MNIKLLLLSLSIVFIGACATAPPQTEDQRKIAQCESNPEVVTSAREFIRIRHGLGNSDSASKVAVKWCDDQNLNAQKSVSSCSGCCITTYQCR